MRDFVDMTGKRIGILTVIGKSDVKSSNRHLCWTCQCDCGKIVVVSGNSLRMGVTNSCGCVGLAKLRKRATTHGKSDTRTYNTWKMMLKRCNKSTWKAYKHYGGRGIKVCERWSSFENFYADMGDRPEGMTLDRIDVNGNYEPSNCRWATWQEQMNNRRDNRRLKIDGRSVTVTEAGRLTGISSATIRNRLINGASDEEAIKPVKNIKS